ncbi:hypothetical protein GF373_16575 [bacterium]|nr:hypothetical protein [bacterium]
MRKHINKIIIFIALFLIANLGDAQDWQSFHFDFRHNPDTAVNMAHFLDKPAGKHGYVNIRDGRFYKGNGERLRIWGINVSSRMCFPEKENAPRVAAYLARMGINGVRFHHMDNRWTGFLGGEDGGTRQLNEELFDRLDFFIHQLKKQGIFINLNLNVARRFTAADGVREAEYLGYAKGATYFDERLIELQKEFATQLLTHYNPYTKSKYTQEPAVMIVEIVNENSLVEYWRNGRLLGKNKEKNPGTWTDIPPSYAADLTRQYNAWLKKNLSAENLKQMRKEANAAKGENIPRLAPSQFNNASNLRYRTEAEFYLYVEERFLTGMYDFLKNELNVKAHIVGSSDHNHYRSGYPHLIANSQLDVVDGHVYWQHPNYKEERIDGRRVFTIPNTPMVNDPAFSTVVQLSRTAVAGKPYTVSETNHPYPNEYACEGVPILGAYMLLQDWDGIFFYTFEHRTPAEWKNAQSGHFDFRPDAMKMANIAACAPMVHRGDVSEAKQTLQRTYTRHQVIDSLKMSSREKPYFTPNFSPLLPLIHKTRVMSLNARPTEYPEVEEKKTITADTGQLRWNVEEAQRGVVTIETPQTQAIIGFIDKNTNPPKNLHAKIGEPAFCTLLLSSLDAQSIPQAKTLLLTATAKAANRGMEWNESRTSLQDWGEAPLQVQIVEGEITLAGLKNANKVTITPLDPQGKPRADSQPAKQTSNGWEFFIGQHKTLWYCIKVER